MLTFSKNTLKGFVVAVLASCAAVAYSERQPDMHAHVQTPQAKALIKAIKVENISYDYARAHVDLMKKPDEIPVSSF